MQPMVLGHVLSLAVILLAACSALRERRLSVSTPTVAQERLLQAYIAGICPVSRSTACMVNVPAIHSFTSRQARMDRDHVGGIGPSAP